MAWVAVAGTPVFFSIYQDLQSCDYMFIKDKNINLPACQTSENIQIFFRFVNSNAIMIIIDSHIYTHTQKFKRSRQNEIRYQDQHLMRDRYFRYEFYSIYSHG